MRARRALLVKGDFYGLYPSLPYLAAFYIFAAFTFIYYRALTFVRTASRCAHCIFAHALPLPHARALFRGGMRRRWRRRAPAPRAALLREGGLHLAACAAAHALCAHGGCGGDAAIPARRSALRRRRALRAPPDMYSPAHYHCVLRLIYVLFHPHYSFSYYSVHKFYSILSTPLPPLFHLLFISPSTTTVDIYSPIVHSKWDLILTSVGSSTRTIPYSNHHAGCMCDCSVALC